MLKVVNDNNFKSATAKGFTLTDFGASWCGPCKMIQPVLNRLSKKYSNKIKFFSMDVDKNKKIAAHYGIMGIPTIIIRKDGKDISKFTGFRSKDDVERFINKSLKK